VKVVNLRCIYFPV